MMTETGYSDRDGITLEYLQREHERVERERYNASSNVRLVAQLRAEIAALKLGLEEEKATNTQARAEIEVLKLQSEKEKTEKETLKLEIVRFRSELEHERSVCNTLVMVATGKLSITVKK